MPLLWIEHRVIVKYIARDSCCQVALLLFLFFLAACLFATRAIVEEAELAH